MAFMPSALTREREEPRKSGTPAFEVTLAVADAAPAERQIAP